VTRSPETGLGLLVLLLCGGASSAAQSGEPDGALRALTDRAMSEQVARMPTDERIRMYETLANTRPAELHYRNLLASGYVQKMRETLDPDYLNRASKIIDGVLAEEGGNYEALRLRSEIELERHNFTQVAAYSRDLTAATPDDPWNWGTLGDSLMELGKYDEAADAYQRMIRLRPDLSSYNRASYYRFVAGDSAGAIDIMKKAIDAGSSSRENVAWCYVDLGNLYFKTGQLNEAGRAYQAALHAFPNYHPAHAGIGRFYAAQGKIAEAIESYRRAQAIVPLVEYAGTLEDLYTLAGKPDDARRSADMVDMIDRMETAGGLNVNRNLALVYADHDRKLDRALSLAQAELKVRHDIYTYDALAWALYKNRKFAEADKAREKALEMGTPEPGFYYHAGMIERALGRNQDAAAHLEKALSLNGRFDSRQAPLAEAALKELRH
jgi:tetratricopeptide (TPR) repeat protein